MHAENCSLGRTSSLESVSVVAAATRGLRSSNAVSPKRGSPIWSGLEAAWPCSGWIRLTVRVGVRVGVWVRGVGAGVDSWVRVRVGEG